MRWGGPAEAKAEHSGIPGRLVITDASKGDTVMPRELIEPHKGDKRYIRRDENGRIKESDDVSRSLSQDVRKDAKTESRKGEGDRGDRKH